MRLRRPLPAVQGDTLHIVGVGDNRIGKACSNPQAAVVDHRCCRLRICNGLTGFGIQVHPSGIKSFFVNYRTGNGGRKASNKRVVLGRFGRMSPDQARRLAHQALGKVAGGADPAGERAEVRGMPLLKQAFTDLHGG